MTYSIQQDTIEQQTWKKGNLPYDSDRHKSRILWFSIYLLMLRRLIPVMSILRDCYFFNRLAPQETLNTFWTEYLISRFSWLCHLTPQLTTSILQHYHFIEGKIYKRQKELARVWIIPAVRLLSCCLKLADQLDCWVSRRWPNLILSSYVKTHLLPPDSQFSKFVGCSMHGSRWHAKVWQW